MYLFSAETCLKLFFSNLKMNFVVSSNFGHMTEEDIGLMRKIRSLHVGN